MFTLFGWFGGLLRSLFVGLLGGLSASVVPWVKKAFVGLGFSYVTFRGFEELQQYVIQIILQNTDQLDPMVFSVLSYMGVFNAMNILFSAWAIGWGIVLNKRFLSPTPGTGSGS